MRVLIVDDFFANPAVRGCFPEGWAPTEGACHCAPKINLREAEHPFLDRVVLIGDCGATRLYKDGIGAAYRTAKASAATAICNRVRIRENPIGTSLQILHQKAPTPIRF